MKLNTIYSYFIIILFAPLMGKLIKKLLHTINHIKTLRAILNSIV